jgi:hypothetical protein
MISINASKLPDTEGNVRAALAAYKQALIDHATTEGVPAPFPQYELLREIVEIGGGDFIVVQEPQPAEVEVTPALEIAILAGRVQAVLDGRAKEFGYDNIFTAVTYADEPIVPKFQDEGKAFRKWRSLVWAACYALLGEVQQGLRPVPTESELFAVLPELQVPGLIPTEQ